ncbi:hypothetical protein MNV49_000973 [Pseudohyphozyma bogoriensis]|nr:hypothetical protein MNV49_000973 [Pseudohyphozyma bogoriensis]
MAKRVTGLQRQIYGMYKRSLKMVASKPVETRSAWYQFIASQFRSPTLGGGIRRKDVGAIEYYLRRGDKMLEQYGSDRVKSVQGVAGERWPEGWVARGGKEGKP